VLGQFRQYCFESGNFADQVVSRGIELEVSSNIKWWLALRGTKVVVSSNITKVTQEAKACMLDP